ncbi:MAG TPA: hypothetical protein VGC65_05940 [Bacteroidia bacterium]
MSMQNFDELKNIWQKTSSDLPSVQEVLLSVEKARKKMMRKNLLAIIVLTFTFIFIVFIALHYEFKLWTTHTGIILTLIAICLGVMFNTSLAKLLMKKSDGTLSNTEYLEQLKEIRTRQRFIQSKGITAYFILLTFGILLYMYEFAIRDLGFGIIAYSITLAWIAFNWFYTRKKTIAKQDKQINEQIESIEKLIHSINN